MFTGGGLKSPWTVTLRAEKEYFNSIAHTVKDTITLNNPGPEKIIAATLKIKFSTNGYKEKGYAKNDGNTCQNGLIILETPIQFASTKHLGHK